MSQQSPYLDRLDALIAERGRFCVGIDPHPGLLAQWELELDASGVEKFARGVVDALGAKVAVFKPQSAFFERFGSAGIAALERTVADIREAGAICLLDAKRGDIGSTMEGYAQAYFGDGPMAVDAVTVSPYLGFESLRPAIDLAAANGRYVYVLARTSNPEGGQVQLADAEGAVVAQRMVDDAEAAGTGLVVGATHADPGIDLTAFTGSVLVPGIGVQGGRVADLHDRFGSTDHLLPSSSREILGAGPDPAAMRAAVEASLAD